MSRQVVANASSMVTKSANGASEEFASPNTNANQRALKSSLHEESSP